jgi:hypothetical protein
MLFGLSPDLCTAQHLIRKGASQAKALLPLPLAFLRSAVGPMANATLTYDRQGI